MTVSGHTSDAEDGCGNAEPTIPMKRRNSVPGKPTLDKSPSPTPGSWSEGEGVAGPSTYRRTERERRRLSDSITNPKRDHHREESRRRTKRLSDPGYYYRTTGPWSHRPRYPQPPRPPPTVFPRPAPLFQTISPEHLPSNQPRSNWRQHWRGIQAPLGM